MMIAAKFFPIHQSPGAKPRSMPLVSRKEVPRQTQRHDGAVEEVASHDLACGGAKPCQKENDRRGGAHVGRGENDTDHRQGDGENGQAGKTQAL